MKNRLPRIPVKSKNGKILFRSRETSEEVMLGAIQKRGFIRCIIQFKLLHAEGQYANWNKQSLTVDMPDIPRARDFRRKLGDAIYKLAKECDCDMPDVVEVPKEE
jgi:hypothetical protein